MFIYSAYTYFITSFPVLGSSLSFIAPCLRRRLQTDPILDEIQRCCHSLVTDQYGNYVVQHVLQHGRSRERARLILKMKKMVLPFSQVTRAYSRPCCCCAVVPVPLCCAVQLGILDICVDSR